MAVSREDLEAGWLTTEQWEKQRILRNILLGGTALALAAVIGSVIFNPFSMVHHVPYLLLLLDHLLCLALLSRWGVRGTVTVFAAFYLVALWVNLMLEGGVHSRSLAALTPLVVLMGLTWCGWAAAVTALVGSFMVLAFAVLEATGMLRAPAVDQNPVHVWLVSTGCLAITAAMLWVALANAARARQRAADSDRSRADMAAALIRSQRLESVGRLAAGVAHDFNNVLTVILGESSVLPRNDPAVAQSAAAIDQAANRAADLTRQLLAFARRQTLEPQIVDVNSVVNALEPMLRRVLGDGARLVLDLDSSGELPRISVDPQQLERVLVNLVTNAREASPPGALVTIRTGSGKPGDGATPLPREIGTNPRTWLAVEDEGAGIPPSVRDRIFEPFFTTKPRGKGSGLGLATVHGIVNQSGGKISVRSNPGHGSQFVVSFPAASDADAGAEHLRSAMTPRSLMAQQQALVLVVDDDPLVVSAARAVLETGNHQVHTAERADQLPAVLKDMPRPPDLLLTDVVMPDVAGPELARRLRDYFPGLRVLFMSGYSDEHLSSQGALARGVHFIRKPFERTQLLDKVQQVLASENPGALGPERSSA